MDYINLTSHEQHNEADMPQSYPGIYGQLGPKEWAAKGWRRIIAIAAPSEGCRVKRYAVNEIDGLTARLIVADEVNIVTEAAAMEAAYAETQVQVRQQKIDNFSMSDLEQARFALALRNFNIPAQYQVTLDQAKEIWRKVVDKEI